MSMEAAMYSKKARWKTFFFQQAFQSDYVMF